MNREEEPSPSQAFIYANIFLLGSATLRHEGERKDVVLEILSVMHGAPKVHDPHRAHDDVCSSKQYLSSEIHDILLGFLTFSRVFTSVFWARDMRRILLTSTGDAASRWLYTCLLSDN